MTNTTTTTTAEQRSTRCAGCFAQIDAPAIITIEIGKGAKAGCCSEKCAARVSRSMNEER
jgi:hypothetical protein